MEKKTFRQMSLLGMLLMGASAITAAIVPSKAAPDQTNSDNNGRVLVNSGIGGSQSPAIYSCVAAAGTPDCHLTELSGTGLVGTVFVNGVGDRFTTAGNTSLSDPAIAGDTTSQLQLIP